MGKLALERLILGALWLLSSCRFFALAGEPVTHPSEVSALETIRNNLNDPQEHLKSWKKGDPCRSNWNGVLCYDMVADDGYLHIRQLQLLNMNLSGNLVPELGQLSHMEVLDFMWNDINGSIPKEIGNITSLRLLLLNGNQLSGSLPEELGNLHNLDRFQIDQNNISGALPKSFANMKVVKHFHMNNNTISGQIPSEISSLQNLQHFLLDNNNLSGHLPPEFSQLPSLLILQLDNNNFSGTSIPASYGNMTKLLKLSLRNCSLQGSIPDMSGMPRVYFVDLSHNLLDGPIPSYKVSTNITTVDFSNNMLSGSIPSIYTGLSSLQRLSLENNKLNGSIPSVIWENISSPVNSTVLLNFQNNLLDDVSGSLNLPPNVTLMLQGNPLCSDGNHPNMARVCGSSFTRQQGQSSKSLVDCPPQSCPTAASFEYIPASPVPCFCAAPIRVGYRLKSPGFSDLHPYRDSFVMYMAEDLNMHHYQIYIDSVSWEVGPRLRMYLKIFPDNIPEFNASEIRRLKGMFSEWKIHNRDVFGPYELLNFTLLGPYSFVDLGSSSTLSKHTIIVIVLGVFFAVFALLSVISLLILKRRTYYHHLTSRRHSSSKTALKVNGVKDFTFGELSLATDNFSGSSQIGHGGYGSVYKGTLADGTVVAIKRAHEGSLQGSREFCTEIELLSRLHHKNLVCLVGYCDEEDEQILVYEFMPNGTLRDHLSGLKGYLNFPMRLHIALGSARGLLYLHTEADPPIFHCDIKASNILLDAKFTAKVADFGLSRLAPDTDGTLQGNISTVVRGTPGYVDPEFLQTHKLTDKSDVYSLGVVFLELLTGMLPISQGKNIVREVSLVYKSGAIFSIVDERMTSYTPDCIVEFASLALRCCDGKTEVRPSMRQVVSELENIWVSASESMSEAGSEIPMSVKPGSRFNLGRPSSSSGGISHVPSTSGSDNPQSGYVTFSLLPR